MAPSAAARRAAFLSAVLAAAVLLSARGAYEPDLGWHLAHGRENAAGRIVRTNLFNAFHPDYPQPYTSWLFDTAAYAAWTAAGGAGIQALQGVLIALTIGLIYLACRVRGPAAAALPVVMLGFFVLEPRAIPRPHLVSFAGLAAFTFLIERARRERSIRPLMWTIPASAIWSNFHMEVLFGVAALAIAAAAEWIRPSAWTRADAGRALLVAAACGVATLATPYGWGIVTYIRENLTVPAVLNIAELQPPFLPEYRAFWIYVASAALLVLVPPRRIDLRDALGLLIFALLGARYLRLTPLVFLATAPAVTARLGGLLARGIDRRAMVLTGAALALAASRVPLPLLAQGLRVGDDAVRPPAFFSEGAVAFARAEGLRGPVFNSFNLGGDLAFALYPDVRIFQDSRLQAQPPGFFLTILRAARNQADWDLLTAPVDWAVLSLARPGELSGVGHFPRTGWATVYWDEAAQVLVRRDGAFREVAERHEYSVIVPGLDPFFAIARAREGASERVLAEARRNRRENPRGYLGPAVLCLWGEADACAGLDRLAEANPSQRDAIERVRRVTTPNVQLPTPK